MLPSGSVFEVLPVHDIADASYAWSFMRSETFLQAGRGRLFRGQLVEPGSYLLRGDVRSTTTTARYRLELAIEVTSEASTPSTVTNILAETSPAMDGYGRVGMQPTSPIVRLTPTTENTELIVLDIDATKDDDGDGNARNDQAVADSFFSTQRTPLIVWFTEPIEDQALTVSLRGKVDTEETVQLLSPDALRQDDAKREQEQRRIEESRARIIVTPFGSGAVKLTLRVSSEYESTPLLVHWRFGDGLQSMLDAPIHRYMQNGSYTVTATVRDLSTAEEIGDYSEIVNISDVAIPDIVVPEPDGTDTEPPAEEEPDGGGFALPEGLLSTILRFAIGIVASVAVGFLFTLLIRFLKKGGFHTAVDKAENALVGSPVPGMTAEPAEPMALPVSDDEEEEENIIDTTAVQTQSVEQAEEIVQQPTESVAPSWLQSGMDQPFSPQAPAAQEPVTPAEQFEATPIPNETEVNTSAEPENSAQAVPPWLAQAQSGAAPAASLPEETQQVAATETARAPEPEPAPVPLDTPQPETMPASEPSAPIQMENAPAWLQQGITQTASATTADSTTPQTGASAEPEMSDMETLTEEELAEEDGPAIQKDWADMTPEEREKERKRQKRQRYRKNKRDRERAEKAAAREQAATAPAQPAAITDAPAPAMQPISAPTPEQPSQAPAGAAPEELPILPAEDDVKFVIGADSISATTPKPPVENADENPA
jgi:PKD repeat protein